MLVSSVARTGQVAESRRTEAVQDTTQNRNEVSASAQARQQQAAAGSNDVQFTRAPEQSASMQFSSLFGAGSEAGEQQQTATDTGGQSLLERSIVTQNNATLQQQIAERVRVLYDL